MKSDPENTDLNQESPQWALAIGPSSPPIRPLSEAELAARASAVNFNPYHDELGRFATGGASVSQHDADTRSRTLHIDYTGEPTKQKGVGAATQGTVVSIVGYGFKSDTLNNCVVTSIRSMIAAQRRTMNVPGDQSVQAQYEAAAKGIFVPPREFIDWNTLGVNARASRQVVVIQKVLENNGVQTRVQSGYASTQAMAAAIIASKQPVMINNPREGTIEEHSVVVQWSPDAVGSGQGRFLIQCDNQGRNSGVYQRAV